MAFTLTTGNRRVKSVFMAVKAALSLIAAHFLAAYGHKPGVFVGSGEK
jgi:hypothetical protein